MLAVDRGVLRVGVIQVEEAALDDRGGGDTAPVRIEEQAAAGGLR